MKELTVIGIDIAKNVLQIHGANEKGKTLLKKRIKRENFLAFMANVPRCLIGMEACGGSNYWAKELTGLGFTVKLMSPQKVKKYLDHDKNDAKDAQACSEGVMRDSMQFVPMKTKEQMDIQAIHRIRSYYTKQRTGLSNMIRGLLLEIGIAIPQGKSALIQKIRVLLEEEDIQLDKRMKPVFQKLYDDLKQLDQRISDYTAQLERIAKEDEYCQRLGSIPGIGPITATAVVAKIGNGSEFQNGRELSAYLGLVPKQHSSGEKQVLLGISKHGDRYLRQLLIHGGRSSLKAAIRVNQKTHTFDKQDQHSQWMQKLVQRVGMNKASVAVANKNARMIVVLLKKGTLYDAELAHTAVVGY